MDAKWTRSGSAFWSCQLALGPMLTIGKLDATRGRLDYYEAQVAAGAEDYYAGRGEPPGRWRGSGARNVGLVLGALVERKQFMHLMRGRSPVDGVELRPMGKRSTVAGLDPTFSAPKGVSVLFAVADDETSQALLSAHGRAVDAEQALSTDVARGLTPEKHGPGAMLSGLRGARPAR